MIKIKVSVAEIEDKVKERLPRWKGKAEDRTKGNIAARHHVPRKPEIWSEAKPFFAEAQLGKCAYCESFLGSRGIRWNVEHYRPKANVKTWQSSTLDFTDQPTSGGYYLLAYDIANYLGSCETCNNIKHNYFPVSAPRQMNTADGTILAREKPLLINPIDVHDDGPEDLIEFYGPIPKPKSTHNDPRARALATIELTGLEREDLVRERCERVVAIWISYANRHAQGDGGQDAQTFLASISEKRAHSSCMRAFLHLCQTSENEARSVYKEAARVLG